MPAQTRIGGGMAAADAVTRRPADAKRHEFLQRVTVQMSGQVSSGCAEVVCSDVRAGKIPAHPGDT